MVGLMVTLSHTMYMKNAEKYLGLVDDVYLLSFEDDLYAGLPPNITTTVLNSFPEVVEYATIKNPVDQILESSNNEPIKANLYIVDEGFGRLFNIKPKFGSFKKAILTPSSIALCESVAASLFNSPDIIGQTVIYNGDNNLTVRAIIPDLPSNTAFNFDGIISYSTMNLIDPSGSYNENSNYNNIFISVSSSTDTDKLHEKLFQKYLEVNSWGTREKEGQLIPFNEIFFRSDIRDDFYNHCEVTYTRFLTFFSFLIFLIAVLNSINLFSGIVSRRVRDQYLELVHGAVPSNILARNIFESVLIFGISFTFAYSLTGIFVERFSSSVLFPLDNFLTTNILAVILQIIIVLVLGLGVGFISSYSIFRMLIVRNLNFSTVESISRKKIFLILQFCLASLIVVATIVSIHQYSFVNETDQGFQKEDILCIDTFGIDSLIQHELSQSLHELPQISDVAFTWGTPGDVKDYWGNVLSVPGKEEKYILSSVIQASNNFPSMMEMQLIIGKFPEDKYRFESYVLNERAMLDFELRPQDIGISTIGRNDGKVIGVVKDYNFESLHSEVTPAIIYCKPEAINNCMLIKLHTPTISDFERTIEQVRDKWFELNPNLPFEYTFLEDQLKTLYLEEERYFKAGMLYSLTSIIIALMGLVAIANLEGIRRSREIAIRKVNGAMLSDILKLFSNSFGKMILTGFIISIPISYLISVRWLESFAYKIKLIWSLWLIAGLIIIIISLITFILSIFPATKVNPIKYLKAD